jgi:hypothetical protein
MPRQQRANSAPELALCRAGESWFDPRRPVQLLFKEQGSSDLMHLDAKGTYRFSEDGQYYLQISGLFGRGCAVVPIRFRSFPAKGLLDGSLGTDRRFPNGQRGVLAGAWQRIG